jgi:Family of unknown function (DUF6262)
MSGPAPRHLAEASQRKSRAAYERVKVALIELDRNGEDINFQSVARRAGVSRQWIYTHRELRAEIDRLRGRQRQVSATASAREQASENSLRARNRQLLEENRRLRQEVQQLRAEVAAALGERRVAELERPADPETR